MKANGKVIKYGDNIDTDVIIPARYLNTTDHKELASHCMEAVSYTHLDVYKRQLQYSFKSANHCDRSN